MRKSSLLLAELILGLLAVSAFCRADGPHGSVFNAEGESLGIENVLSPEVGWQALRTGDGDLYDSVADVNGCTGAWIEPVRAPSAPAYVLTAGHCFTRHNPVHLLEDGEALTPELARRYPVLGDVVEQEARQGLQVRFARYSPEFPVAPSARSGMPRGFRVARVAYASQNGTDIALLELAASQGELRASGYLPFALAARPPRIGERIELLGLPDLGRGNRWLRRSTCRIRGLTWSVNYNASLYAHDCSTLAGSSGSPLVSAWTGQIVGIHVTGQELLKGKGMPLFLLNQAAPTAALISCFRQDGWFDPGREGCALARKGPGPASAGR